jgi:uncharacterized membrane protein
MLILLRLLHILGGVFWAGTLIFVALFLEPSVREAGPDGAKVMQALLRRKYLIILPLVALITIVAGILLLQRVSGGFDPLFMRSRTGMALSIGGGVAILAFLIGVLVMRPAVMRLIKVMSQAGQSEGAAKAALMAEADGLRRRMRLGGRWVAGLLTVTVLTMAVARYLV